MRVRPKGTAARKARAPGSASERRMAWVEIGALQSCCSQLALSASWVRARWVLDKAVSAERGTGTKVLKEDNAS